MSVGPRSAFLSVATELVEEREVVVQCLREFGYGLADKLREAELFVAVLGERPDEQVIAALSQDTVAEHERLADLAEHLLDSNPRRIKRLLNTYRYLKTLNYSRGEPVYDENWQRNMLSWLGFSMRWRHSSSAS